jgi:hypothetical protein
MNEVIGPWIEPTHPLPVVRHRRLNILVVIGRALRFVSVNDLLHLDRE